MTKEVSDIRDRLIEIIEGAFTEKAISEIKKRVDDIVYAIESDLDYRLRSGNAAVDLAFWVQDMAEKAILAMLDGDDEVMRRYLKCEEGGWTGRDTRHVTMIRGNLFETDAIKLRRQIVEANADLLRDERVKDLEAQLDGLVAENRELQDRINRLTGWPSETMER